MDHQRRRLLNEIGANVEKIAADVDKLQGMPLNYALRRGIQETIRKLDGRLLQGRGQEGAGDSRAAARDRYATRSPASS
jgi:hypothetical protein